MGTNFQGNPSDSYQDISPKAKYVNLLVERKSQDSSSGDHKSSSKGFCASALYDLLRYLTVSS